MVKILNVEKARLDKMLNNEEIKALISAVGGGIGTEFDVTKARYHKIILMTDADVDGSHIRTLLLTFFFRYMKPVIESGYLYIAQPPLYKAKIGKHEEYLKDEKHFRNFLFNWAHKQLICKFGKEELPEKDWSQLLADITRYESTLDRLCINFGLTNRQGHKLILFLAKHPVTEHTTNEKLVENLTSFFTDYSVSTHKEETTEENPNPKTWFNFKILNKSWDVSKEFFASEELPEANKLFEPLKFSEESWTLEVRDKNKMNSGKGVMNLLEGIHAASKPYLHLQRYKGLGEMNAEDLWETSMDPAYRSLLQVSIEDALEADSWFSTLMGDNVAGRKEFIEKNGRFARNLDV